MAASALPQGGAELEAELEAALAGDIGPWRTALVERPWADPFRTLRADRDRELAVAQDAGFEDLSSWLKSANVWIDTMTRPGLVASAGQRVLHMAWESFQRRLSASLARTREPGRLPASGGVLAFVDGLNLCLVVDYRFYSQVPRLRVIDAIEAPRTVFDVVDVLLHRRHETRAELKRMLQSSHRLVWHRDVLVHVDRREEPRVFGPSIDTLHLAELIAARYGGLAEHEHPARVLELGTGSGFLATGVLRNLRGVKNLTGIELDASAAFCTHRNWRVNTMDLAGFIEKTALVVAPFRAELAPGGYDLVICNPPYIPDEPDAGQRDDVDGRHHAVAGLELLDDVLAASHDLVRPGGEILLVVSSVTPRSYVASPEGFDATWPWGEDGTPVLFEVESVFARPALLQSLAEAGGLSAPAQADKYYEHRLHAVWLTRPEAA